MKESSQTGQFFPTCSPIFNCKSGKHDCSDNAQCKHTCTCKKHFTGKNGTVCTAVYNCKLGKNVSKCGEDAECVYTTPGFNNCTCRTGFFGDGSVCTRENPCTLANGGCSANGKCAMTRPGKSACLCNTGFRGDGFACKSADAPAGTVAGFKASLTLNMDYAFVSTNRAKFDKAFSKDVADSRGLPEAAVTVSTVSAGSVVVDFAVKGTETCKPGSMTISPTELSLLCPSCPPVTVSAMKCTGVVMTVPEPEGPLQVFRVTHYLDTSCDVKTEYKSHVAVDMAAALSIRKQAIVVHNVTAQVSNKVAVVCTITGGFVNVKAIKDKLKGAGYPSLARVCSTPVVPATTAIVAENDPAAKPNQCLAKNGDCHDKATCAWLAQDGNKEKTVKCTCSPGFKGDGTLLGSGCVSTCKPCPLSQQKTCSPNAQCCMKLGKGAALTEHTCACKVGFLGNGLICTKA